MNPSQPTTKPQPSFDIKLTTPFVCEKCGNETFIPGALMFRRVSPLMTKTGQPALLPIEVMACVQCGAVPKEFIPQELKDVIITPSKLVS